MNKYQEVMLTILKKVVSEINDYEWYACGGTLLGAIREKGFIEWDTDIDLYVSRECYDYIMSNPQVLEPYKIEEHWQFIKVYDENTTGFAGGWKKGISIDLFPFGKKPHGMVGDIRNVADTLSFNEEWYNSYTLMPFEDIEVRVPIEYEKCLEHQYGNWREPNKEGGQHSNASCVFSLEKEW